MFEEQLHPQLLLQHEPDESSDPKRASKMRSKKFVLFASSTSAASARTDKNKSARTSVDVDINPSCDKMRYDIANCPKNVV